MARSHRRRPGCRMSDYIYVADNWVNAVHKRTRKNWAKDKRDITFMGINIKGSLKEAFDSEVEAWRHVVELSAKRVALQEKELSRTKARHAAAVKKLAAIEGAA